MPNNETEQPSDLSEEQSELILLEQRRLLLQKSEKFRRQIAALNNVVAPIALGILISGLLQFDPTLKFFSVLLVSLVTFSFVMLKYLTDDKVNDSKINEPKIIANVGENSPNLTINVNRSDEYNVKVVTEADLSLNGINEIYFEIFNRTRDRLLNEIRSLNRRGNLNLVIGFFSACIGMGIVAYLAFHTEIEIKNALSLVNYLPRLTLALFAEILALFFLQLYRASLSEIKYFQNELTSLECKFFAFLAAVCQDDKEGMRKAGDVFANVERNFIIKKDETTPDLEKSRIDQQSNEKLVAALISIFKTNGASGATKDEK